MRSSKAKMTTPLPDKVDDAPSKWTSWMDRPLSSVQCFVGWLVSSALFLGLSALLGGPSEGDAVESLYSTWAVAHGKFSCIYPLKGAHQVASIARPSTFIAPLYPLISGAVAALLRIGHDVAFPSSAQLGPNCSAAVTAMYHWSLSSNAVLPSIRIAYLGWLILMAGAIALLRASNRGRTRWEVVALLLLAVAPPALESMVIYLHPQDLIALGLILGALALIRRDSWVWAGILLGLATTSQQFALLALAPLLVVAPRSQKLRLAAGAVCAAALIIVPVVAFAPGRALRPALIGSGSTPSNGGTLVEDLRLHGMLLFAVARLLPIALGVAFAWWAKRRLGPKLLEPVALVALIATTLGLRLVFEENLFGYYFTALTVMLILLDAVKGRIRGYTIAWLALVTLAFDPIPWGFASNGQSWGLTARQQLPAWFALIALLLIAADLLRKRIRWYILAWLVVDVLTLVKMPWVHTYLRRSMTIWFWQIVLVPSGLALAVGPLLKAIRLRGEEVPVGQTNYD